MGDTKSICVREEKDFAENERNYKICYILSVHVAKKDENGCKLLLKKAEKATMDIILASTPAAVKAIIIGKREWMNLSIQLKQYVNSN